MRNYKKFLPARYLVSVAVCARLLPPLFSLLIQIKENEPQSAYPPPCGATRPRTPTTYGPEATPHQTHHEDRGSWLLSRARSWR